jgi:hypothetical protein
MSDMWDCTLYCSTLNIMTILNPESVSQSDGLQELRHCHVADRLLLA